MNYILKQDFNWFGKNIPKGTRYVQHGADYWWPVINGLHIPTMQVDFMTVRNNPDWFEIQPIQVLLFEGIFSYAPPPKPNTGPTYVHQFHTDQPLPPRIKENIEQLIQEAINK